MGAWVSNSLAGLRARAAGAARSERYDLRGRSARNC